VSRKHPHFNYNYALSVFNQQWMFEASSKTFLQVLLRVLSGFIL
jgi:hypothetical protein